MILTDMLHRQLRLRRDHVAMTFAGRAFTYGQMSERVHRAANALLGLGVHKGERVAVLAHNSNHFLELYFANAHVGSVTTPLNYRLTPPELEYIINDSEAVAMIVAESLVPAIDSIRARLPKVRHWVCIGAERPGYIDYETWIGAASDAPPQETVHENDLVWQMYTSGTTGRPKGAMITHRNLLTNVLQLGFEVEEMSDKDRTLVVAPLFHAAAVIASMVTLARGARVVIQKEFLPQEIVKAFDEEGVTHALFVPAMILFLLNMPGIEQVNFGTLRHVLYGAAPIPLEVLRRAMALFQCKFVQGFGQTESVAVLTSLRAEDHALEGADEAKIIRRLQSCGRELFGTEVRIVDAQGEEVPRGEVGEIVARGDQVMRGYWKLPEATAEALRGGWLHTGDLGTMDEDGYVYVVDRLKDMIVSGAENIFPREIEELLFQHPAIADVAVIGVPSDEWGEEPKAIVVLKPGAKPTEAEILGYCEGKLARFKWPRSVEFVASLPRNPAGKVLKRELREPYWKGKSRRVN
jgi:fatty-acyl-CoA synthase